MGLVADSLDMLADSIVYGLSLLAVGHSMIRKKKIAKWRKEFRRRAIHNLEKKLNQSTINEIDGRRTVRDFPGHSIALKMLGVFILWFG